MANRPWWWDQAERNQGFDPNARTWNEKLQDAMQIPGGNRRFGGMVPPQDGPRLGAPPAAGEWQGPPPVVNQATANQNIGRMEAIPTSAIGSPVGVPGPTNIPLLRRDFFDSDGHIRAGFRSDSRMSLDPGQAEANANGVPLGLVMAPVPTPNSMDPRAMAMVGRPDDQAVGRLAGQAAVPGQPNGVNWQGMEQGLATPMGRGLANSGVIGATANDNIREQTLAATRNERWGMLSGPSRARNALEVLTQQQQADQQAQRQVKVAQGTPQVVSSPGGIGGWDPSANDGKGAMISEVRAANQTGKTLADHEKVYDPTTGMTGAQLLSMWGKARPRAANDPTNRMMLAIAIGQAKGDPAKIQAAQNMYGKDNPGDPQQVAFALARLKFLGIDPEADTGVAATPAATGPIAPVWGGGVTSQPGASKTSLNPSGTNAPAVGVSRWARK